MELSRSARYYRERAGRIATERGPVPRLAPDLNQVHRVPVSVPLPDPRHESNGQPPPDRGLTTLWPHPESEDPQ